jgi:hypothetical protein
MQSFYNIPRPSFQPVSSSSTPTNDPITKHLATIGQITPRNEARWMMSHGRFLAGFGSNDTQPAYAAAQDGYVGSLEKDDDVNGSGIFDEYGRMPTVNATLGVFQDHPSIPGYIDREIEYSVNKEIVDIANGADVVTVAGGGLTYQERGGLPRPFDRAGTGPKRPDQYLTAGTNVEDVFVGLTEEPYIPPMVVAPVMPDIVVSRPQAAAPAQIFAPPKATSPNAAPSTSAAALLPPASLVDVRVPAGMQTIVGQPTPTRRIAAYPGFSRVGSRDTSRTMDLIKPIAGHRALQGFGDDSSSTKDLVVYALAGAFLGAAAGYVYNMVKEK